jgi:hypothetical protein
MMRRALLLLIVLAGGCGQAEPASCEHVVSTLNDRLGACGSLPLPADGPGRICRQVAESGVSGAETDACADAIRTLDCGPVTDGSVVELAECQGIIE